MHEFLDDVTFASVSDCRDLQVPSGGGPAPAQVKSTPVISRSHLNPHNSFTTTRPPAHPLPINSTIVKVFAASSTDHFLGTAASAASTPTVQNFQITTVNGGSAASPVVVQSSNTGLGSGVDDSNAAQYNANDNQQVFSPANNFGFNHDLLSPHVNLSLTSNDMQGFLSTAASASSTPTIENFQSFNTGLRLRVDGSNIDPASLTRNLGGQEATANNDNAAAENAEESIADAEDGMCHTATADDEDADMEETRSFFDNAFAVTETQESGPNALPCSTWT
ncbi:uncharacterized protein K452DRAFT_312045 [Aplosporella prunicola CBS 121167]|uniref:Uncharacterized protein n=1 Tax=Aplosporella prunicola CBS 121167 TaxID=1176127 RepID=A0A6A6B3S1_9PEZI|nr:uncharacterized protein K452DRAFT_312045 [Aplosporella prunicola CBS 121167]KAF2137915.1 hypothetical protein K452DRAFT_312045 [Aplosporella prunicola CBS 121167]